VSRVDSGDSMMGETFEQVRDRMQRELDETQFLDTRRWLKEFPEYESEIREFVLDELDNEPVSDWAPGEKEAYETVAAEAVEDMVREAERRVAEMRLGARIAAVPHREPLPEGSTRNYARALLMAFTVHHLYVRDPWIDRVKLTKALYLLEEAVGPGVFTSFEVTTYGLSDADLKHAEEDAEKRGTRSQWIVIDRKNRRRNVDLFLPGPRSAEATEKARDYLPDTTLAEEFLHLIGRYSGWELGAWQTIHLVGKRLVERRAVIDLTSLKAGILEEAAWQDSKFGFREFHDDAIEEALEHLSRLRLLPADMIDFG
jgi:hypothetical protein